MEVLRKYLIGLLLLTALLGFAVPSYADYIAVDPGDYSGTRSLSGGGIIAGGAWASDNPTLTWDIGLVTDPSSQHYGLVQYTYTWTASTGGALSHIILEVSADATANDFVFVSPWLGIPATYSSGNSNPNMPYSVYGIKFNREGLPETTTYEITFYSTRLPMWGDFYAKDGQAGGAGWNTAWNTGFGTDPTGTNFTNWVAVPDTRVVPLPGALWLLGAGLLGLVGIRRRMTQA